MHHHRRRRSCGFRNNGGGAAFMYLCICLSSLSGIVSLLYLDPDYWNPSTAAKYTQTPNSCAYHAATLSTAVWHCSLLGRSRIISAQRLFIPRPLGLSRYSDLLRAGRSGDRMPAGRGVDHPYPSSAEVKERVKLYFSSLSGPSWPVTRWVVPLPLSSEQTRNGSDVIRSADRYE